jgi:hypothetical protein
MKISNHESKNLEQVELALSSDDWGEANHNPMVRAFGKLDGKKCKTCKHLIAKRWDKVYYKCSLRLDTNGPGTDHRVNWTACNKYQSR